MKKLNDLTKQQKIKLTMGADCWGNYDAEGTLYQFTMADASNGLRMPVDRNLAGGVIRSAISYPGFQTLSHTWNTDLAYEMGYSIGNDCVEAGVDILLGPGINIKRTPLCGRNFEYLSEDPYLAGTLAREYVKGVQAKGVAACVKHYCCNNSEYSRLWVSSEVDERTMREIYLRPFEIAMEAQPWTVMSSYNLVNGVRMSHNKKMYDLLRNELGFNGMIMSDWCAVKDPIASVYAGCNMAMPYEEHLQKILLDNVDKIDDGKLDACVQPVLDLIEKCEKASKTRKVDKSKDERRKMSQTIAEEGIVLLKNDGVLPLKGDEKVVLGGAPGWLYYQGGGAAYVQPEIEPMMLTEALVAEGISATWSEAGIHSTKGNQARCDGINRTVRGAAYGDCTVFCVGEGKDTEYEGTDRVQIKLSEDEELAIHALARVSEKLIVVVYAGSAIDMSDWIDEVDAVVWAGYGGQYVNNAVARVLTGKVNPSGKLTETFPMCLEDVPSVNAYRDECCVMYSEGLNVGYRYFDTFDVPVLFPFGYGLSYSSFEYENLTLEKRDEEVIVSFDIKNTSEVDGKEIAQVYVREITREVYRPNQELKGFTKVFVRAGESVRVEIKLDRRAFAYYNTSIDGWKVHEGMFEIRVGASCEDIRLSQKIEIK